jgi:heme O synthase-like polyprenyltransferase
MLNTVIAFAALLTVIMLVYSGIKFIISAGDDSKIEEAQKVIIYSLIGLVVVFIAPLVIRFILGTLLGEG